MAPWIFLVALIYVISWAWLFTRVGNHAVKEQQQGKTTVYNEAM